VNIKIILRWSIYILYLPIYGVHDYLENNNSDENKAKIQVCSGHYQ
jgi:hypothetical protein